MLPELQTKLIESKIHNQNCSRKFETCHSDLMHIGKKGWWICVEWWIYELMKTWLEIWMSLESMLNRDLSQTIGQRASRRILVRLHHEWKLFDLWFWQLLKISKEMIDVIMTGERGKSDLRNDFQSMKQKFQIKPYWMLCELCEWEYEWK
jgi:hypothetical protein